MKSLKGFTLLELLVAISISSVLLLCVGVSFTIVSKLNNTMVTSISDINKLQIIKDYINNNYGHYNVYELIIENTDDGVVAYYVKKENGELWGVKRIICEKFEYDQFQVDYVVNDDSVSYDQPEFDQSIDNYVFNNKVTVSTDKCVITYDEDKTFEFILKVKSTSEPK